MKKVVLSFVVLSLLWGVVSLFMSAGFYPIQEKTMVMNAPQILIGNNGRLMSFSDGNKEYVVGCATLKNQDKQLFCDVFNHAGYVVEKIEFTHFYTVLSQKQFRSEMVVVKHIVYQDNFNKKHEFTLPDAQIERARFSVLSMNRYFIWYFVLASYLGLAAYFLQNPVKKWLAAVKNKAT